jgi:hypothetical protein
MGEDSRHKCSWFSPHVKLGDPRPRLGEVEPSIRPRLGELEPSIGPRQGEVEPIIGPRLGEVEPSIGPRQGQLEPSIFHSKIPSTQSTRM